MPKGPQGQKRPADAIGLAVMVGKIATGEIEDSVTDTRAARQAAGEKGGASRIRQLDAKERSALAKQGAKARWETDRVAPVKKEPI